MLVKSIILSGLLSTVLGFIDTASVYSNKQLPSKYIISSDELISHINDHYCQEEIQILSNYNHLKLDEIPGLELVKHVKYNSLDSVKQLESVCEGRSEKIEDLSQIDQSKVLIIQNIPSFPKLSDNVKNLISSFTKRDITEDEDMVEELLDEAAILEQVEQDFRVAESMAAEEDGEVSILNESPSVESVITTKTNNSLFNTYQFFTPGIFMCMIVSFLLLFIFSTALGWLNSIEITYKSFEKEIDYEKKNE